MTTRKLLATAVLLALSSCLLTACGGGGSSEMVRPEAIPAPPVNPATGPCSTSGSGDCIVTTDNSSGAATVMGGGRQSDHGLIVQGDGYLYLDPGDYRFSGGTTVTEDASLGLDSRTTLSSDVHVTGTGSSDSGQASLYLAGAVVGDVANDGIVTPGSSVSGEAMPARIEGNFSQSANGTLAVVIGATTGGFLTITGRADLAGTLQLVQFWDWDSGYAPLPGAPLSLKVLHADGGVAGEFAQWTAPDLFVTGAPRYLANDVYFDVTALSAAQVMGAVTAQSVTVRSAGNFDAAIANASSWANTTHAPLTATQRQFLASVGMIQRLQDYGQATRTFNSLSGHGYGDAADALLQQAALPAPELMARVGSLHAGSMAGSWSAPTAMLASGAGAFSGARAGFDQWLGERTLAGTSFSLSDGSLRFGRSGGNARDRSPQWDAYLRHNFGDHGYVFGDVGYSRHQLEFNRQIDLGSTRQIAGAQNSFDLTHAYLETGRDFRFGQARLTPFGALSYAMLQGAGFSEQGNTGFELIAQPFAHQRINALAGVRLGADWRSRSGRWTKLNLTAGYRQLLLARDDARAAFTGTPDVTFALAGAPGQRNAGWLQLNVATGGERWAWLLSYDRQASAEAASAGMQFTF